MRTMHVDDLALQPLRIPAGWTVEHNQFFEVAPGEELRLEGLGAGGVWDLFGEDMLLLRHDRHDCVLDLGWYPEADPAGRFRATLIRGGDWERPLGTAESRDKGEVVAAVEKLLAAASAGS